MSHDGPVFLTAPANNQRKRLWELPDQCHCTVVGTCLTLGELRRLARKTDLFPRASVSDYELHRAFVGTVREAGYVSRLVQKHLDRKYQGTLRQFAAARAEGALAALWDAAVSSGEVAGAYWALVTHAALPEALLERVHGEVHMMSHLSGASCRADMQELAVLRARNRELEEQLAQVNAAARRKAALHNETIRALNGRLSSSLQTEQRLREAEARLRAMEEGELFGRLQTQVEEYAALLANARAQAERAEATAGEWQRLALENGNRSLRQEQSLAELQAERDALEAALERLLAPDCSSCENRDECGPEPVVDLCGRCVLYVGGRDRQWARFRVLVERQNGRFLYHDGGVDDSRKRLGSILPQADAVLCPLDCVSHDAVNRVKRFCKRNGKQLVFLPRSSLAAFTRGLNELAA